MNKDLILALRYAWFIATAILLCAAAAPFLIGEDALGAIIPPCTARLRGSSCMLCGMTAGFFHISRGEFAAAGTANAGSAPLYFGFCLNALLAIWYGGRKCRS